MCCQAPVPLGMRQSLWQTPCSELLHFVTDIYTLQGLSRIKKSVQSCVGLPIFTSKKSLEI